MSGNLPPGVTQNDIDRALEGDNRNVGEFERNRDYDDKLESLQNDGLGSMSSAPRDREIIVFTEVDLLAHRAFWHDDMFDRGGGDWMDANGDGATDGVWRHWDTDELIGWLPANPLIGGV